MPASFEWTILVQFGPSWGQRELPEEEERTVEHIRQGISWHRPYGEGLLQLVNGLDQIPEVRLWLAANSTFIKAMKPACVEASSRGGARCKSEEAQLEDWVALSNRLEQPLPSEAAPAACV